MNLIQAIRQNERRRHLDQLRHIFLEIRKRQKRLNELREKVERLEHERDKA